MKSRAWNSAARRGREESVRELASQHLPVDKAHGERSRDDLAGMRCSLVVPIWSGDGCSFGHCMSLPGLP